MSKNGFGERLKTSRIQAALSQKEVAKLLHFKRDSSISNLEKEIQQPNLEQLKELARVLRVSPCWLAFGEDKNKE